MGQSAKSPVSGQCNLRWHKVLFFGLKGQKRLQIGRYGEKLSSFGYRAQLTVTRVTGFYSRT